MTRFDDDVLMAYVDGELDEPTARQVEAAIREDPETRRRVDLLRQSAAVVRDVFRQPQYQRVSETLARRFGAPPATPRRPFWRFVVPVAASIAAAVTGFGVGFWRGGVTDSDFTNRLLDEVAEYHVVFARERDHQVEVTADRVDEIQSWLGQRLGRTLRVPDLSGHGLIFRGARLLVVSHRPVGQFVYSFPDQLDRPLALCIAAGPPEEVALRTDVQDGVNLAVWGRKGFIYVLAGWVDQAFLAAVTAELAPALDETAAPRG
jgi:anti-sigma factor RsiW